MDEYRVSHILVPNSYPIAHVEKVTKAKGLGIWIYCKYCYKHVLPKLSGRYQVVCSKCGSGLTPDFNTFEELVKWLKDDKE